MAQSEKDFSTTSNTENGQSTLSVSRPFSARSHKSFKQLVKMLGPALKVHLGILREEKVYLVIFDTVIVKAPRVTHGVGCT